MRFLLVFGPRLHNTAKCCGGMRASLSGLVLKRMAGSGEHDGPNVGRDRPWRRHHLSTTLVLAGAATLLVALNVSGFGGVDPLERRVMRYGWPASCFSRTGEAPLISLPPGEAWPRSSLSGGALLFDLLFAVASLALAFVVAERRRRWRHVLQYSLSELLLFTLVLSGACGWAFHDYRRQQAALEQLTTLDGGVGVDQALPEWLWRRLPYLPGGKLKPLDRVVSMTLLNVYPKDLEKLDALWGLTHLERLEFHNEIDGGLGLAGVSPDDRQVWLVSQLNQLVKLRLCGHRISDAGLASLERLTRLRELELSCPNVSDEGLAHVARLDRLERLQIWQGSISQTGLAALSRLSRLQALDLGLYGPSGVSLLAVLKQLPALKSLKLTDAQLAEAELAQLAQLEQLESLSLLHTQLSGDGLEKLVGLRRLQALSLVSSTVTDDSLAALAGFRRLKQLTLLWTPITDAGISQLTSLSQLERLEVNESASWHKLGGVSRSGVDQLRQALPGCEIAFYQFN